MDSNDIPPLASPPPAFTPPPVIGSPVAPRPRKSRGWMVVAIVLLVFLLLSLLANFSQLVTGFTPMKVSRVGSAHGPRIDETIFEDNDSPNKILLIDVEGIITGRPLDQGGFTMVDLLKEQLKRADEDDRVKAIVLRVDSPGGEVLASDEIYREIVKFQETSRKPVITSMGNLAASGGYYIASASRWIVANELTITGSIGVIMHSWNYRELMNKVGLRPEVYKSGLHKDMLSGERNPADIPPEERAMIESLIMETYGRFKTVVAEGRRLAHEKNQANGKALVTDWDKYADGRVFSGKQALGWGFVDEVGNFDVAVKRARQIANIQEANLVQYKVRYDLADFFRMFGKNEAPTIKVDFGMEAPKLDAGKLYFLSPTFLH